MRSFRNASEPLLKEEPMNIKDLLNTPDLNGFKAVSPGLINGNLGHT